MDKPDWNKLRQRMKKHHYPQHREFDPETLLPANGSTDMYAFRLSCGNLLNTYLDSLLDVGSNKGFFSFTARKAYKKILGIDPIKEAVQIANDIRDAHNERGHINFLCVRFEHLDTVEQFDVVHFGQVCHYLFRDGFRRMENPLWFLVKAKKLAKKYIAIDGAFDGDPSVEYDAKKDGWPPIVKRMATIEGYAGQLRPEFRLIRYGWSGDGASRYMAIFERI